MNRLTVLMYHEIVPRAAWPTTGAGPVRNAQGTGDVLPPPLYVWEDDFQAQMDYLEQEGYTVIDPERVLAFFAGADLPNRAVLLTFDDLWKSGMNAAFSILRQKGWKALAFLVRGWVFDEPQVAAVGSPVCLARGEWEAMAEVFAFANHTDRLHTRGPSGPAVASVDAEAFVADLRRCEEWTTLKGVFAFPFGAVGPGAVEGLRREGFRLAFTTEPGSNERTTDPLRLKRNLVPRDLPLDGFAKICDQ